MTRFQTPLSTLLTILAVSLMLALPALADQSIDETRKADKDAVISIDNLAGSVTVTGWNRQEVKITGTLDDKAEELKISGDSKQLSIEVRYPDRVRNINEGSRLTIQVPAGCQLEIRTVSAEVTTDKTEGALEVKTVSGKVTLRGKPASVRAETVSGLIDVDVQTDRANLANVSGTIKVAGVRGDLSCRSVSGKIQVDAGKDLKTLGCDVVSGDITVTGQLARKAEWDLSAHSGNVNVELAGKVDARFRLKTFSGDIDDVMGHQAERTSKYAPGKELSFTEGGGDALVKVDVFSGRIRVK
jgi:DUF4097 and DUF4098 domain-containing protein YvlB